MADKSFRTIRGKDAKRYTMVEINRYRLLYAGRTSPAIRGKNPPSQIRKRPAARYSVTNGETTQAATIPAGDKTPKVTATTGTVNNWAPIDAESAVLTRAGIHGSRMSVIHFPARMIPRSAA